MRPNSDRVEPLEYEPLPTALALAACRKLLGRLGGIVLPAVIEVIDEGDCHRCKEHRPRHAHGTSMLLCRPCLADRLAFERRIASKGGGSQNPKRNPATTPESFNTSPLSPARSAMSEPRCYVCLEELPVDAFAVDRSKASGRKSVCKSCDRRRVAERWAALHPWDHKKSRAARGWRR